MCDCASHVMVKRRVCPRVCPPRFRAKDRQPVRQSYGPSISLQRTNAQAERSTIKQPLPDHISIESCDKNTLSVYQWQGVLWFCELSCSLGAVGAFHSDGFPSSFDGMKGADAFLFVPTSQIICEPTITLYLFKVGQSAATVNRLVIDY